MPGLASAWAYIGLAVMVEIVAEISGNHGGNLNKACHLIDEAAACGCDYVKFQYYRPEDMPDRNQGDNEEMYRKLMVHDDWLPQMFSNAHACGVGLFASVFSVRAVRELLKYDVPFIKIASPDSTGLDYKVVRSITSEVPDDVQVIWSSRTQLHGKTLYCPLGHPPTITYRDFKIFREGNFYGFSDHTPGIRTPLAFIRAGAGMIEKHFKLEYTGLPCKTPPIDAAFSADPFTMKTLCRLAHNKK